MKYFISGGAGFIGSHLATKIISEVSNVEKITIYDNLSSGQLWHLKQIKDDPVINIVKGDLKNLELLKESMRGHNVVYHLAANPDIAKAATEPTIDFWEGTLLLQNVLEAIRINGVEKLIYTSGSGVYGDKGEFPVNEDIGPLLPVSTYGASKLACEALISSYCHMFNLVARVYRFANVVGPKQTHGVAYDFIRKLRENSNELQILGDGSQSKSYIHIADVLDAIFWTDQKSALNYDYYNVATGDYITVTEIADLVTNLMSLEKVKYNFSGGKRGWKGDVPVVRFDLTKILSTGWKPRMSSQQALSNSIISMLNEHELYK